MVGQFDEGGRLSLDMLDCCQLESALFAVDMNTTTTDVFTSTQVGGLQEILDLCFDTNCV